MKHFIYTFFKSLGLKSMYLKGLFFSKQVLGIKQKEFDSLLHFYKQLITKDSLVFDVGANIGNRSNVFLALGSTVVAVEPNTSLYDILQSRFRAQKKIHVLNAGCGAANERREFRIAENHLVSSFSQRFIEHKKATGEDYKWAKSQWVDIITLDQLIKQFGSPDFCKIDVEGFEKEVLLGLNQRVGMISFEFTSPTFNPDIIECINKLSQLGYRSYNISFGETLRFEFEEWISSVALIDFIQSDKKFENASYGDIYAR